MIYVKRVKARDLKGNFVAELGPRTLILGPNASGKTRLIAALEYGTTGKVSDLRGRALVAEPAGLKALGGYVDEETQDALDSAASEDSALDAGELMRTYPNVELTLADTKSDFTLTVNATGAKPGSPFPNAFPLRAVREAIEGSSATLRKFLVRYAVGKLTREDILARLLAPSRAAYTDAAGKGSAVGLEPEDTSSDELNGLLGVIEWSKKKARRAADEHKALEKIVNAAPPGTSPATDEELAALEARVQAALQSYSKTAQIARNNVDRAQFQRQLDALVQRHPELLTLDVSTVSTKPFAESFTASMAALRIHATNDASDAAGIKCNVCGDGGPTSPAGRFRKRLALVEAKTAAREYAILKQAVAALGGEQDIHEGVDAATAAKRVLDEARAVHTNAVAVRASWKQVDSARAQLADRLKAKDQATALAVDCEKVVRELLQAGRTKFVDRVQAFLPDAKRFGLELTPTRVDFGLMVKDDGGRTVLQTALCGAEEVSVYCAIALATCTLDTSPTKGGPVIVATPDRGLDANTLSQLMSAWNERDASADTGASATPEVQVILQGVVKPVSIPHGWTVVRTGELSSAMIAKVMNERAAERAAEESPVERTRNAPSKGPVTTPAKRPETEAERKQREFEATDAVL